MIEFYNEQAAASAAEAPGVRSAEEAKAFVDHDSARFSWGRADYQRVATRTAYELRDDMIRPGLYRPFFKQALAFDRTLNDMIYRLPRLYPDARERERRYQHRRHRIEVSVRRNRH